MAKSSPRKTLKSLFSRSEASLDRPQEKDVETKNEGERKRFKFPKLKIKSKSGSSSEKTANKNQQVLSAAEPGNSAEDKEASTYTISSNEKKSFLYGTAPRSKGNKLSYSEFDLRKPKRFATFSFGFKKKKKRDEENISKSTFGLHSTGTGERGKSPLDLSHLELDQTNKTKMFSMSQPELDMSDTFDIPSPPPVASNQPGSCFTLPNKLQSDAVNNQKEAKEPLMNGSSLCDIHEEPQRAPIATIPELQLDYPDSSEENTGSPVSENSFRGVLNSFGLVSHTETTSAADDQTVPVLPAEQHLAVFDTSDYKAEAADSDFSSFDLNDHEVLQQPHTKTETSIGITFPQHQPDVPDAADSQTPEGESSLADDFKVDSTITESVSAPHTDGTDLHADSSSVLQPLTEISAPETDESDTKTSAGSAEKKTQPPCSNAAYGALYESLFPQSFTAEVMASLLQNAPQTAPQVKTEQTEIRCLSPKLEPVMVKTLSESYTDSNVAYSPLSALPRFDSAVGGFTHINTALSEREEVSSGESFYQTFTDPEPRKDLDYDHGYLPPDPHSGAEPADSSHIPYSELTHSLSEIKSDRFDFNRDTVRSVPVSHSSAPPVSDYVTTQGTDTRVTDSIRRVILVKELVTDEESANTDSPSPEPEKMSTANSLEINIDETAGFSASSGKSDNHDGPVSPTYLSVGSDDGSTAEMYYSAEEDDAEIWDEDTSTMVEREDMCTVDGLQKEFSQQEDMSKISKGDEGESKVLIVIIKNEEGKSDSDEKEEDVSSLTDVQQLPGDCQISEAQVQEAETSEFLEGNDAKSPEREAATAAFSQVKEEEREERQEELPATPVQQVNTAMVCDFVPPSSEPHGQGEEPEGNWTKEFETEDHLNGETQLPGQEIEYLTYNDKDTESPDYVNAGEGECEGEESPEGAETKSSATTFAGGGEAVAVRQSSELQLDATETEDNQTPPSSEWVDTITQSANRTRTVVVELSVPSEDTHHPDTEAADTLTEDHDHPAEAQPDLNQGSTTASERPTAAPEDFASENQPTEADQESVDIMNSGYGSLSTKLSLINSSLSKEDELRHRFRKVSLINEADDTEARKDTVDFTSTTVTEVNGEDSNSDSEYRWKNRFEGVSQYKAYKTEDSSFTDPLSYRTSDTYFGSSSLSSSSPPPEAPTYKYHSTAYSSPSSSYSPSAEEHITLGNRLNYRSEVYLSSEGEPAGEQKDEWRRSLVEQEEPAAPAGETERRSEGESERIQTRWESEQHSVYDLTTARQAGYDSTDSFKEDNNDSSPFTGVFQATRVELVSEPAAPPSTPPASPDADSLNQFDMENLVDTLKSMGPSTRPRSAGFRGPPPVLLSSLPPIVEDAPSPVSANDVPDSKNSPTKTVEATGKPGESLNGLYTLPADLGLKWSSPRDTRSPLELMKQSIQDQQQPGTRGVNSTLRPSVTNSITMRRSSSFEDLPSPVLNGNGIGSRLENSVIFASHRSTSIDQTLENRHRPLFHTNSLPETGLSNDRSSFAAKEPELVIATDPVTSRFERFSFLLNSSSSSTSGSLTGAEDPNARISRPLQPNIHSPPAANSPTRLLSPTGSIDLHRSFTTTHQDSPLSMFSQTQGVGTGVLSTPILQRSFSGEGTTGVQQTSLFNNVHGGSQFQSQEPEPERNLALKYRAFPDAYLTKEKEHGKLNPRPGKMYIFDRTGMCGQRIEVRGDVVDATPWELQETISIRVVRGGWVLYEKPNFKGEKIALDEGDIELAYPFNPPEEQQQQQQQQQQQNGQTETAKQNGETSDEQSKPARKFIIGSIRRAVRDYSVPEICLFPEENAEGKKVIFRDTSDDARIFGFPIKANSIIINAGLWLVYAHPFFQGVPRVLEVGGYTNPAAWGVEQPYVGSLHPLKVGEPRVENQSEPKMVIYDKPYFSGKSRTVTGNLRDFISRTDVQQTAFMYSVGSLKVMGGIWVGYEKEGFRGHQYLLEEGEYHDWRVWGGRDAELRSVRLIRADLTDPMMVMFEQQEDQEDMQEENTFEVTEAIPDVELFGYKTGTRSIHVLSGAWIAYSHVDFSGDQYILEKGFYNSCADWGSENNRICSVQPILLAMSESSKVRNEITLYSEPNFQGECHLLDRNQEAISEKLLAKSCRVSGGSWVVYENKQFSGNLFVLSEGEYPNLTSMGCTPGFTIRSVKVVPTTFSVPSISLFGLECLEGREITVDTEILSMIEEGFNNHILSVRVNRGCWVLCEYGNYRGRQFLLEPIEIPNWQKFSSLQTVGSMYPVRQKRCFFRIKNKERGHFMSIQGGVEEMKSGRVVVSPEVEPMSDIWFYQDGLIKSKLSPTMSLQVMGNVEPASKVVLWSETRQPVQTWTAQMRGLITSLTFPGMVLDVKGGKTYDKDHVVIHPESDERPSQQWEIELL